MKSWGEDDIKFMRRALELAELAKGRTSPNPMVGAVIVKDGKTIGEGYHRKAGADHAEIDALKNAKKYGAGADIQNATMYVNLEPCCHWGKTPPCAESLIASKIGKVVMAMIDPNPKVKGMGKEKLESHTIAVECGLLENEAQRLNEIYTKYITTSLPFVTLKAAMSLDGKIATAQGDSKWITSESCRLKAHKLRDENDAILVGLQTILKDDPSLTTRLIKNKRQEKEEKEIEKGTEKGIGIKTENEMGLWRLRDPIRVIADSEAKIPLGAKALNLQSSAITIVAVTDKAPSERVEAIKSRGAEVMVLPSRDDRVDLRALMVELGKRGISSILIEGGGKINASALEMGLVDKVIFFIAPKIIGGGSAPTPVDGKGIQSFSDAVGLCELTIEKLGDEIIVEAYVQKGVSTL